MRLRGPTPARVADRLALVRAKTDRVEESFMVRLSKSGAEHVTSRGSDFQDRGERKARPITNVVFGRVSSKLSDAARHRVDVKVGSTSPVHASGALARSTRSGPVVRAIEIERLA
jgi:hypothetical protein